MFYYLLVIHEAISASLIQQQGRRIAQDQGQSPQAQRKFKQSVHSNIFSQPDLLPSQRDHLGGIPNPIIVPQPLRGLELDAGLCF